VKINGELIMNGVDILRYGHGEVQTAIADLPENEWYMPGVCGHWSVREIIAHLASYEQLLIEVLTGLLKEDAPPTPTLDRLLADEERFNDDEVARRCCQSAHEVWTEYEEAHETAVSLLSQIPLEGRRLNGVLSWYGDTYDLEDFLVYTYYGHKREHCAQIAVYRSAIRSPQSEFV
jgi:hypothetical protein